MPKHAICVQCHERPEQINLMLRQFPEDSFDFYIHVDKKSGILPEIERRSNVRFVPDAARVDVRWGRWSLVEAALALLEAFDPAQYDYVHLISGCDFPIKPPQAIIDACDGAEYIQSKPMEDTTWAWGGLDRVLVRYPDWLIHRPHKRLARAVRLMYREFVMRTGIGRRRDLPVERFFAGSAWFSITGGCAAWMKDYVHAHPEYADFFRTGACVDEIFFSTLARLSPYAERIVGDPMRYIRWEGGRDGGPAVLEPSDIPKMRAHRGFFARKAQSLDMCEAMTTLCRENDAATPQPTTGG